MENSNSLNKSNNQNYNPYNPLNNADQVLKTSIYSDYGQDWLAEGERTLRELGENSLNLRYLEKSLKSKRRLEQRNTRSTMGTGNEQAVEGETEQTNKYDLNGGIVRKFPFKAEEFRYPNDSSQIAKTVYLKSSREYGNMKPNDMELPSNLINNQFR
jgi:hypothetical protein